MVDPSIAQVHIDVVDINDNPPHFEKSTFYAGESSSIFDSRRFETWSRVDVEDGTDFTTSRRHVLSLCLLCFSSLLATVWRHETEN